MCHPWATRAWTFIIVPLIILSLGGLVLGFDAGYQEMRSGGASEGNWWSRLGGALLGFAFGATIGFLGGRFLAWVVDLLVSWRARRLRRESKYPPLARLRQEGWTIHAR
jgi:hypothetical protein